VKPTDTATTRAGRPARKKFMMKKLNSLKLKKKKKMVAKFIDI